VVLGRHPAYQIGPTALLDTARDRSVASIEGAGIPPPRVPAPSLDRVPNNSAKCTRIRVVSTETGEVAGLRCGSWRCERCAVGNRRAFSKRLRLGLSVSLIGHEIPKLLTLTSRPGEDPAVSRRLLSRRFANVRRHLERAFPGCHVDYAGSVELTQRGAVHFHVVLRGVPFMPQSVWSRSVGRLGFGPVVDIRRVQSGELGRYLSKSLGTYLTKGAAGAWPAHFRRVRFSASWAPTWVSRSAKRDARGGDQRGVWRFVRCSPYQLDELDGYGSSVAGQGRLAGGALGADP
jgi:hypothetical protein